MKLYSSAEVAAKLQISQSRVVALAHSRNVGTKVGSAGFVFTDADIKAMRTRTPGRPKKKVAARRR